MFVFIYLLYGFLNLLFANHSPGAADALLKWGVMLGGFLLFRRHGSFLLVSSAFICSGVLQSVLGILSFFRVIETNHVLFDITGSFANPGQLGGYLAVCFVISIVTLMYLWKMDVSQKRKRWLAAGVGVGAILIFITLILTGSRAALLSAVCGTGYYFFVSKAYVLSRKQKRIGWLFLGLLVVFIFLFFFSYRQGSIHGRLLIWQVSAKMVEEAPFTGHGIGSFSSKYMLYQAGYFMQHPHSAYAIVADNVAYPFNEYIHILVEQGVVGLICFLLLLVVWLLPSKNRDGKNEMAGSGIMALSVFAFFSYPSDVFVLLFIFAVLGGCMGGRIIMHCRLCIRPAWVCLLIAGLITGYVLKESWFRETMVAKLMEAQGGKNQNCEFPDWFCNNSRKIAKYPFYYDRYVMYLSRMDVPFDMTFFFKEVSPYYEHYCAMGDYMQKKQQYPLAAPYYLMASYMIPARITANYKLFNLYRVAGDTLQAVCYAQKVLSQPVKVENTQTIKARAEVAAFMEKLE